MRFFNQHGAIGMDGKMQLSIDNSTVRLAPDSSDRAKGKLERLLASRSPFVSLPILRVGRGGPAGWNGKRTDSSRKFRLTTSNHGPCLHREGAGRTQEHCAENQSTKDVLGQKHQSFQYEGWFSGLRDPASSWIAENPLRHSIRSSPVVNDAHHCSVNLRK